MADTWQVVRRRNGRESVVFDGTEDDARQYLQNNYPRVHVEPGSGTNDSVADALLKSPTEEYSAFHGPETGFVDTDENGTTEDRDDDNDDDDDVPARTPAKKTAAKKTAAPAAFGGTR